MSEPSAEQLESVVKDYILAEFLPGAEAGELELDTPLISGGILDSIATLKLISHLEEEYDIEFESHELDADSLDTIALIAEVVKAKL